jgi:hypothetical protein
MCREGSSGASSDLQRFLAAFDNKHTLAIEAQLRTLNVPTLIVWGPVMCILI